MSSLTGLTRPIAATCGRRVLGRGTGHREGIDLAGADSLAGDVRRVLAGCNRAAGVRVAEPPLPTESVLQLDLPLKVVFPADLPAGVAPPEGVLGLLDRGRIG